MVAEGMMKALVDQQRLFQSAVRCGSTITFITRFITISAYSAVALGSSAALKALMVTKEVMNIT